MQPVGASVVLASDVLVTLVALVAFVASIGTGIVSPPVELLGAEPLVLAGFVAFASCLVVGGVALAAGACPSSVPTDSVSTTFSETCSKDVPYWHLSADVHMSHDTFRISDTEIKVLIIAGY